MKRFMWLFVLMICISAAYAVSGTINVSNTHNSAELIQSNQSGLDIRYALGAIGFDDVSTQNGSYARIFVDGYAFTNRIGMPQLPLMRKIIRVPLEAHIVPSVVNRRTSIYQLSDYGITGQILPRQESVSKSENPLTLPFAINQDFYHAHSWTAEPSIKVEEIGMLRGVRLVAVDYTPIQYNPANGQIEVTTDADIRIEYIGADWNATQEMYDRYYSSAFEPAIAQTVFNYEPQRTSLDRYPLGMIIVTPSNFVSTLQPFIEWKTKQGYNVTIATPDLTGTTTTAIKAYLQNIWNNATTTNPAPSYLLIIGDTGQTPSNPGQSTSGHVTDLAYVRLQGADYIPEMYFGRMSATSTTQLQAIIDKTLQYEMYTMPNDAYLAESVLIAGVDATYGPTHANGQINYGQTNYFNTNFNINNHQYLYPASGNSESQIIANMNSGAGFVNYTAHGSETSWSDPSLTISNINALTNANKYFVAVGNCCLTSAFDTGECFAEAFTRAPNKGAVVYLGGTNSTYWDEDYYWAVGYKPPVVSTGSPYIPNRIGVYDGLFHSHNEAFADWCGTTGAMNFMGNVAVTASNSSRINYYWEIYSVMGDPSLIPYMGIPQEINATYQNTLFLGLGSLTVSADPYTYVALSMNGQLKAAALTDANGDVSLNFVPFTEPGTAQLVMTRSLRKPLIASLQVLPGTVDYVMVNSITVNDGNNAIAEAGETMFLNATFNNVGTQNATNVVATLTSNNPFVTILNGTANVGNLNSGSTIDIAQAFRIAISASIADQSNISFNIQCSSTGGNVTNTEKTLVVNAPNITFTNINLIDADGDGAMESGETITVNVSMINNGHMAAGNGIVDIVMNFNNATLSQDQFTLPGFSIGINVPISFQVTLGQSITDGTVVPVGLALTAGGQMVNGLVTIPVGLISEGFETGNFTLFNWTNTSAVPWTIVSGAGNFHTGLYGAKTGAISHGATTELSISKNVTAAGNISFWRKVSTESGYDYFKFYIDNIETGSWSGTQDWAQQTYPVTAGQHTFKWSYIKDYSVSSGQDCAWIDDVVFPLSSSSAIPMLYTNTTELDFTDVPANVPVSQDFALRNLGTNTLSGTISIPDDFSLLLNGTAVNTPYNYSIAAGETRIYSLYIVPELGMLLNTEMIITSNDTTNPTTTIPVHLNAVTGNDDDHQLPVVTALMGNYPNPFNPVTTINFATKTAGQVQIHVFNTKGQLVRTLLNENKNAGYHKVVWNGMDAQGKPVSSGVYLYRMQTAGYTKTSKMMLMK